MPCWRPGKRRECWRARAGAGVHALLHADHARHRAAVGDRRAVEPRSAPSATADGAPARRRPHRRRQRALFPRSEEHTPELQSLMHTSYAVSFLQKKKTRIISTHTKLAAENHDIRKTTDTTYTR